MVRPALEGPERHGSAPRTALFLVGFMGAGKSSVGRVIARKLRWQFVDLDDRVEAREGKSVAEIFREHGEVGFREAESAALVTLLHELSRGEPAVVALGGGAYVQDRNAEAIRASNAAVVFLDAPVEELRRRCKAKGGVRPLFADEQRFRQLYESRREQYQKADLHVGTGGRQVYAVAREIISLLGIEKKR